MVRLPAKLGDMTARSVTRTVAGSGHGRGAGAAFHRASSLEFAPLPGAIPCARLHAAHILHEWGLRALAEDAALIISELMTNAVDASAVLPGRPPVALRLLASERSLVIEVWDASPGDVAPREAGPGAECGRGLTVVAALSDRWDWERTGHRRKVVWAELARRNPGVGSAP
jgi:anti-sigma regulatory factor (Ser/Thr protein kinase)